MEALVNQMRLQAQRVNQTTGKTRLGLISGYDPNSYAVKVTLQPDGTETGFIPFAALMVGNQWGIFIGPAIGAQVIVDFAEDAHESPIARLQLFDNNNRPLPVQSGEMWLVHQTGSYVKLTNDGKVSFNSGTEIDAGNLGNTLLTLVTSAFQSLFNNHIHTNGNDGSDTGPPTTQMTSTHLTTVLRAN